MSIPTKLQKFKHVIDNVQFVATAFDCVMHITLKNGFASQGSTLIICKGVNDALDRLSLAKPA